MVERKEYLDQLWAWKDEQQIKVVTGIRRCGKSVLLEQYQQRLLANGVIPEQIISIKALMHICCQVSLQRFCREGTQRSRCCRFLSASI